MGPSLYTFNGVNYRNAQWPVVQCTTGFFAPAILANAKLEGTLGCSAKRLCAPHHAAPPVDEPLAKTFTLAEFFTVRQQLLKLCTPLDRYSLKGPLPCPYM